jgi:hypothetical protein
VGASTSVTMKSSFPYVGYRYGFIKNDAMQLGLSLGVAWLNLKTELAASAGVVGPGGPILGRTVTKTAEISPVAPMLGVNFEGRLGDGLSAGARFMGVVAEINPYSGYIVSGFAHIDWYPARNFGVGTGYEYTKVSVEKDSLPKVFVDYSYRYDGPRLYIILTF